MLLKPRGRLSSHVQAIWSVKNEVQPQSKLSHWLQGDACSGVLFNLGSNIVLEGNEFGQGAIFLPVSKKAHQLVLPKHCQLVGIRFKQGVSAILFDEIFAEATALSATKSAVNVDMKLQNLAQQLTADNGHFYRLRLLYRWLTSVIDYSKKPPASFIEALDVLENQGSIDTLTRRANLSQRQIERQYRKWLDMTPNQYLRLMRVNKALRILKSYPQTDLAALALDNSFSDQSHMTREFKEIAGITPLKYANLIALLAI
ncbi:MAG: helix-turn-helix domain-containing protein [Oceanospirillaceae bacterium]